MVMCCTPNWPSIFNCFHCCNHLLVIHHQVYRYLEKNGLLKDVQSSFRQNRSTQDILLGTVGDWKTALDQCQDVAAVMIDLSKAFDTVNHNLLANKLAAYGIREGELRWFTDYLSNRRQRVVINGAESDWNEVTKRVPQGTILGPLLFVLFMNNLPDFVQDCSIGLYADDIMLYISHSDPAKLSEIIGKDLYNISR